MLKKIQNESIPTIVDTKKRYSHWDKIRHLKTPNKFDSIEQYWHFIKASRLQQQKLLPFIENFSFILTDDIQEKIHQIDSKMHGSVEAKNINENKDRYIVGSLIDEAISSSQLEGAATTRKVARNMLKHNKPPENRSQQMIYNNYLAIQFINRHKQDDLTPSLILELHAIVTNNAMDDAVDVGRLRQDNEVNVVDNRTGATLHHPPDFQELPSRLKILCDFANGNAPDYFVHPIIRAIVVHFALAYDHPFADGNGRTTRALFYWVMLKNDYWLFEYITLSTHIKKAQIQYDESFLMVENDDFDLTYFINSQLKFIQQSITGLFDYIEKKQQQAQDASNLLSAYLADGKLNTRQVILMSHAVKHPGASYTFAGHQISHHIGYATAKSDLEKLAKLELLQQSKQGRAFIFIAPNNLEQRIKAYK
ncbi:Fic family protein [Candidatus Thioglobus sp.]